MNLIKFRCSSIGYLMTNPKSAEAKKNNELSETAKTHIEDVWIRIKYDRKKFVTSKYLEKGLSVEDDSIALVGAINGTIYQKNEKHFENDYLTGTPDIIDSSIIDTKSNWDIFTFFRSELTDMYEWQLRAYMALTGVKSAILAYCLVNTPEHILQSEITKASWPLINAEKYTTDQEIIKRLESEKGKVIAQIYRNATFNDIPIEKRCKQFKIEWDEEKEKAIYEKVKKANLYFNTLTL